MNKRTLYIILGIIAAIIIALLLVLFLKDRSSSTNTGGTTGVNGSLPITGTQTGSATGAATGNQQVSGNNGAGGTIDQSLVQSFNMVFAGPVLDYFVDNQNTITAIEPNGTVVSAAGNQTSSISSSVISNIISASFSYDGKKILVSFGDPTNPQASVFDVMSKAWTALPQGMISPKWSSSSYQIAYLTNSGTGAMKLSLINIANVKSVTTFLTLNANDLTLQWVGKTQFLLSDKPSEYVQNSAWMYDSQKGTLVPIAYEEGGVESVWGQQSATSTIGLLYVNDVNTTGQLTSLVNATGNILHNLNFVTLPTKCAIHTETSTIPGAAAATTMASTTTSSTAKAAASSTYSYGAIYCGVPLSTDDLSLVNLPDDYNQMAAFTIDEISKLNSVTGEVDVLWNDPSQTMDVSDVHYFNNAVFFVNRYDLKLYALTLVTPAAVAAQ